MVKQSTKKGFNYALWGWILLLLGPVVTLLAWILFGRLRNGDPFFTDRIDFAVLAIISALEIIISIIFFVVAGTKRKFNYIFAFLAFVLLVFYSYFMYVAATFD